MRLTFLYGKLLSADWENHQSRSLTSSNFRPSNVWLFFIKSNSCLIRSTLDLSASMTSSGLSSSLDAFWGPSRSLDANGKDDELCRLTFVLEDLGKKTLRTLTRTTTAGWKRAIIAH